GGCMFDFVHESDLAERTLSRSRALLVPNAAYLADEPCRQIRAFVQAGGSLLATFETSRYDAWGDARGEPALADLFGVSVAADVVGPAANSYMRIEQRHAVLAGFEGTALLPGPENRLPVRLREAGQPALTVVPSYPAFPPEMVYARTPRTDDPALGESGSESLAAEHGPLAWGRTATAGGDRRRRAAGGVRVGDGAGVRAASAQLHHPQFDLGHGRALVPHRAPARAVRGRAGPQDQARRGAPQRPRAPVRAGWRRRPFRSPGAGRLRGRGSHLRSPAGNFA